MGSVWRALGLEISIGMNVVGTFVDARRGVAQRGIRDRGSGAQRDIIERGGAGD